MIFYLSKKPGQALNVFLKAKAFIIGFILELIDPLEEKWGKEEKLIYPEEEKEEPAKEKKEEK